MVLGTCMQYRVPIRHVTGQRSVHFRANVWVHGPVLSTVAGMFAGAVEPLRVLIIVRLVAEPRCELCESSGQ